MRSESDSYKFIDLKNLHNICRGDNEKKLKYLKQFVELITPRTQELKRSLEKADRANIRHILHKMSPQLQFFGVNEVIIPIRRMEFEYLSLDYKELKIIVLDIIAILEVAVCEVLELIAIDDESDI